MRTVLFVALVVLFGSNVSFGSKAWDTCMADDIPGKNGWMTCLPFAKELHKRLSNQGVESHLITFKWVDGSRPHMVVVYRDADGRYFGMDNRSRTPKWLSGQGPEDWIVSWYGGLVSRVTSHVENVSSMAMVAQNQ